MTEQQAQNIIAFLELARTAIDNAELRIVGATEDNTPCLELAKGCGEIAAASVNLREAALAIERFASAELEKFNRARTTNGAAAGKPVVP